ncbi:MAG: aldo/keto reductase, partial [Alkalispirochaeta sp.]
KDMITEDRIARIRGLNEIARRRGQSLAQMALSWVLRRPEVTSVLIGASSLDQIRENVAAAKAPPLTDDELSEIDTYAVDSDINLWAQSSRE